VKPEQASKCQLGATSRHRHGEVRRGRPEQPTGESLPAPRGNGRSTYTRIDVQHGRPDVVPQGNRAAWDGTRQESEEPIVPMKPRNGGGGKGPWFGVRPTEPRGGRLA
jgi:hypothetical protein